MVLGKTQAGKSTFIEFVKNYADPSYEMDRSLIGFGNTSCTAEIKHWTIETDLPKYEVVDRPGSVSVGEQVVDLETLMIQCNKDDYIDILNARNLDLRIDYSHEQKRQSSVSESYQFLVMDTPGLNDTNERDHLHANNILEELARVQTFHMILIVIPKHPLTRELQLALEYYAKVFSSMTSVIAFLHTHTNYAYMHPENAEYQTGLMESNKFLQRVFLGHAENASQSDTQATTDSIPYFEIDCDMATTRPMRKCITRNKIREILARAVSNTPVTIDTSRENMLRLRNIPHPAAVNAELKAQAQKIRMSIYESEGTPSVSDPEPQSRRMSRMSIAPQDGDDDEFNILLIGDNLQEQRQLAETIKQYADPKHSVYMSRLAGRDPDDVTGRIDHSVILTDLPTFGVIKRKKNTGSLNRCRIEPHLDLAECMEQEEYEDLLEDRQGQVVRVKVSNAKSRLINLFEGPQMEQMDLDFEEVMINTYLNVIQSGRQFHMVLFALSPGIIGPSTEVTLKTCAQMFSHLRSQFVFVHTKTDYSRIHPSDMWLNFSMQERNSLLDEIMGFSTKSFMIDTNFSDAWPYRTCLTQNIIHDILQTATMAQPSPKYVPVDLSLMKQFDRVSWILHKETFLNFGRSLQIQEQVIQQQRAKIAKCKAKFAADIAQISRLETFLDQHDSLDLEVFWERRLNLPHFIDAHDKTAITLELPKQELTIHKVETTCINIELKSMSGGKGHQFWKCVFKQKPQCASFFRVKLFTIKEDKYHAEIASCTRELAKAAEDLEVLRQQTGEALAALYTLSEDKVRMMRPQQDTFEVLEALVRKVLPQHQHDRISANDLRENTRVFREIDGGMLERLSAGMIEDVNVSDLPVFKLAITEAEEEDYAGYFTSEIDDTYSSDEF